MISFKNCPNIAQYTYKTVHSDWPKHSAIKGLHCIYDFSCCFKVTVLLVGTVRTQAQQRDNMTALLATSARKDNYQKCVRQEHSLIISTIKLSWTVIIALQDISVKVSWQSQDFWNLGSYVSWELNAHLSLIQLLHWTGGTFITLPIYQIDLILPKKRKTTPDPVKNLSENNVTILTLLTKMLLTHRHIPKFLTVYPSLYPPKYKCWIQLTPIFFTFRLWELPTNCRVFRRLLLPWRSEFKHSRWFWMLGRPLLCEWINGSRILPCRRTSELYGAKFL